MMEHDPEAMRAMRVALAGFGTVGQELARRLAGGAIPEMALVAISARDLEKARRNSAHLTPPPIVVPVAELPMTSRNRPSLTNPRTSRSVAPSVMAALRSLVSPLQVGS
jgi:aspartate dehydrogenase